MFYNDLEPDNESPMLGTPKAPILEEEEGGSTRNLRDLLERKMQKREPSTSGSQKCIVVREPGGRLIYRLWRCAGLECIIQEGPKPPERMVAQEEVPTELVKETQIQPEEELKEINLRAKLGSQKLVFISSQLTTQEKEQLVALLKEYMDVFA